MTGLSMLLLAAVAFEQPRLVPMPQRAQWHLDRCVELSSDLPVVLRMASENCGSSAEWLRDHVKAAFGVDWRIAVLQSSGDRRLDVGEYFLNVSETNLTVAADTPEGVRYAFQTLRQLAVPKRGTMKVEGWTAPACEIADRPKMPFRGIHLCWFRETEERVLERCIRLAGYYKLNHVVLESWGTYRSERHPWWGWKDGKMTRAAIGRLKSVADDLGVTQIPQVNVLGHAGMCPHSDVRHAVLDAGPEYQPLYEPHGGWNWCQSNPAAQAVVADIVAEMHEAFGNPPYFHIGLDEARPPSCPTCRAADYVGLVASNVARIVSLVEKRGARAMAWHDMLLKRGAWGRFNASARNGEEALLGRLPKSVVICDWYYGGAVKTGYPTLKHFRDSGHDVVTATWTDIGGAMAQARAASEVGAAGVLGTTWKKTEPLALGDAFVSAAAGGWGTEPENYGFADHWRQMGWDMAGAHRDGACGRAEPAAPRVDDRMPAGCLKSAEVDGDRVHLERDYRDTADAWFYWAFRVRGAAGRTLTFDFPGVEWAVGARGAAVSTDCGRTWRWSSATEHRPSNAFGWTFADDAEEVWFSQTLPYLPKDWAAFLNAQPERFGGIFELRELCKSRRGRSVPYVRFGRLDGKAGHRLFVTARHHAQESTASLVVEGMAARFFADDELGRWLRENVELRVVPFVDYDGVVDGDQGKNRRPHDHCRDYNESRPQVYPEVAAVMRMLREWRPHGVQDTHCPWLRSNGTPTDTNGFAYQVGNAENGRQVAAFGAALERVQVSGFGYRAADDVPYGKWWNTGSNFTQGKTLNDWAQTDLRCCDFVTTFEIPFADQHGKTLQPNDFRGFGHDLMLAWRVAFEEGLDAR